MACGNGALQSCLPPPARLLLIRFEHASALEALITGPPWSVSQRKVPPAAFAVSQTAQRLLQGTLFLWLNGIYPSIEYPSLPASPCPASCPLLPCAISRTVCPGWE